MSEKSLDELEREKASQHEIWELTIPGRVHVQVTNHLGRPRDLSAKGRGARLRLTTLDRELAEERIRNDGNNPFRNGMMVRVDRPADSADALTDEDLRGAFKDCGDEEFRALLEDMTEVNLRRMKALTREAGATVSQNALLDEVIAERFPLGGTVPSWEEIMRNPES